MKRRKRKLKKKKIILLFIILIFIILFVLIFTTKNNNSLDSIGYSKLEIQEIEKLSDKEIKIIEKYKYSKNLIYIISSENYKPNKLDLYLKYSNTYNNIDYFKIIDLINNKNFNEKNIDKYITLLEKSDDIKAIINYVNKYPDKKDIDYTTLSFFKEKYFIYDNLDRYIAYHKENKDLSFKEVITRINSNLDYNFYEDAKPCDTSKGMYTLVNKYFYLDEKYIPEDIVSVDKNYTVYNAKINKTVYDNFMKLANDAKDENLTIKITTGYRDYNFQNTLYNNYVKADGVINADKYSARPGYSEHQLGYSVDLTNAKNVSFDEFENTEEFKWLKDNAYKYGFILRYPKDKEYITGYIYEAWHYRYVGVDIASYIYKNDITYEEYYEYFLR